MRYVWIVLLALSLSTVVYGQKSAAVRQLEQQRKGGVGRYRGDE